MKYIAILLMMSACSSLTPEERVLTRMQEDINRYTYIAEAAGEDYTKTSKEFYEDSGGDCEDYVVAKYDYLITHGYNRMELIKAVVRVKGAGEGELHAVLIVRGRYVLDIGVDKLVKIKSIYDIPNMTIVRRF